MQYRLSLNYHKKARQLRKKRWNSEYLISLYFFMKMSLNRIQVKPQILYNVNCLLLFLFARSRKTHSKWNFTKKVFLWNVGVKVLILDFQSQNGTRSHIFDEILLLRSLLKDKTTDLESFWKSLIFTPQKSFKSLRFFLYWLYITTFHWQRSNL